MRCIVLLSLLVLFSACKDRSGESQGKEELDRAIEAIEDRRKAEFRIIEEQKYMIEILEGNLDEANSEGMRQKIRDDITEKEVTIEKAEKNLENQEVILEKLYFKRDSLIQSKE